VAPVADSVRHVPAQAPAALDPAVAAAGRVVPAAAVPTAVAVTTAAAEAE